MNLRRFIERFWPALPDAHSELPALTRWSKDLHTKTRLILSARGVFVLSFALIVELAALILCWRFDLTGWPRLLLRISAVLVFWLWLASARRRDLNG